MNWQGGLRRVQIAGSYLVLVGIFFFMVCLLTREPIFFPLVESGVKLVLAGVALLIGGWIAKGFVPPQSGGSR
jgi:hypothetical protein